MSEMGWRNAWKHPPPLDTPVLVRVRLLDGRLQKDWNAEVDVVRRTGEKDIQNPSGISWRYGSQAEWAPIPGMTKRRHRP